ncbi:MAG: LPS assembly lipoprotein LptE [Gemmatimonadota bacterium]
MTCRDRTDPGRGKSDRWFRGPGGRRPTVARLGVTLAGIILAGGQGTACYSFSGGGGLPSGIKTAYVAPIVNQTTRFGLSELLNEELLRAVTQRLGLRLAAEGEADAIVRATIRQYSDNAVNFSSNQGVGANVFLRRVTIGAQVEIYDVAQDALVWQSAGVAGVGEYEPGTETEQEGLEIALENLVQKIVDGAQSQW